MAKFSSRAGVAALNKNSPEYGARLSASKLRKELSFSSENFQRASYCYVAWIDLMGAGTLMSVSLHKAANAIARIHLAVALAESRHKAEIHKVPINDGVFIVCASKRDIVNVLRTSIIYLAANFIARPNHPDRFLVRSAVAYGPVHFGREIEAQLTRAQAASGAGSSFAQVVFGPPIIQAYQSETFSPAYGVAVQESARSFSPADERPFRTTLWRWWQTDDDGGFSAKTPQPVLPMKDVLIKELFNYFLFLEDTLPFQCIPEGKVDLWRKAASRYFLESQRTREQ